MQAIMVMAVALACAVGRTNLPDGPVSFQTILSGTSSMADTAAVYYVTDSHQWQKVWRLAVGHIDPIPEVPTVDFKQTAIIAAFMGQRASSGYRLTITEIVKTGAQLTVAIEHKRSAAGAVLPVLTSPFQIVSIPRGDYELKVKITEVSD